MLYNESTGKPKVQADVFSLEGLIAWLEKQPADKKYNWSDQDNCLLTQYLLAHGEDTYGGNYTVLRRTVDPGHTGIVLNTPWTFGAALTRAMALR